MRYIVILLAATLACDPVELRELEEPTSGSVGEVELERLYGDCGPSCDGRCYNLFTLQPPPGAHFAACADPCEVGEPQTCPQNAEHPATCLSYPDPDLEAKLHGVCALRCDGGLACPEGMVCAGSGLVCLWPQ